jgi:DNA-binding protein HU-beta
MERSMKVNKADLIRTVENRLDLPNKRATQVVNTIVGTITKALASGEEVRIADFGKFFLKQKGARTYRPPGRSTPIHRGPCQAVGFTAFNQLSQRIAAADIDEIDPLCLFPMAADERRQTPRADLPDIGSAIVRISGIPVCEFKIKDISDNGSALWVEEDSVMLRNIRVGQEIDIRINHPPSDQSVVMERARIAHITKSNLSGRQGLYMLGIQILGQLPI